MSTTGSPAGERTLALAAEIAALLAARGARSAVIGAVALAVRGYPRATEDLDLATVTDPFKVLQGVADELRQHGYAAELSLPDADDPLGGVLTVRVEGADPVQVVNYFNPWQGWAEVGKQAVETAEANALPPLAVVDVPHLIALKLYAGGAKSQLDVLELIDRQPALDLESLRQLCRGFGLERELERLLQKR
jgi:hypothetical protein